MAIVVNPILPPVSAVAAPIIVNTAAELSLLPANGQPRFLAGTLGEGSTLDNRLFGIFSNRAAAPGTITLKAKLGGTVVWSSGALAIPAALHTDITFWLDILLMLQAGGAAAKVMGGGILQAILGAQSDFPLPATAPASSGQFESRVDLDLDLTAQFSAADPGNKIQLLGYRLLA